MKCPNCQTNNPDQAKFCMNCGTPLSAAIDINQNKTGEQDTLLEKFIPHELINKIEAIRARNEMVGERRVITMLFCDVKGSTSAAEKVDPETWTEIMNGIFEYMIRPVYKYEGTIPRLMGDAILAFFGAPIAHEDDPQRAVLAGLEIQEGIKEYIDEMQLKHGIEFGLRVGINTGLVVVGTIGSDLRMEYTAIGDAINLAARMEQTAKPGTVQISEETYKLVAPFFEFEALGEVEVKGKAQPIKTYRPTSVKGTPGQLRGLDGLSSPLVGRDSQFASIKDRLRKLSSGTGSVVAIVGEAGLGKSTLISESRKSDEESDVLWLRGDSLSYTRTISYYPWRQIIRQSIDARDDDSPAEVRHKLGYACDCCSLPGGDIPFLEAMLAVESEESSKVVLGFQGDALNQRMIEATRGFLCGLAVESPLVIVFDDLHWSDEASLNLLLNVVDLYSDQPILFICLTRPDKAATSWVSIQKMREALGDGLHLIDLVPLQVDQTEALLSNLLGVKDMPKTIRDLIVEKAEGNPFFVEEIIRSLIETGQIVRENNHWRIHEGHAKISLPNTLRGVLGARIDRLPEASKQVLQNAAVIGRVFDVRVLKTLTGLNGGLDAHIQYLKEASLVEMLGNDYAFRHVLIQEAAYESILIKQRKELHRLIGEALEKLHAGRIEEFAPLLANHFYNAEDERSFKYDLLAGEKSMRLYANVEAATHFSRALEVAKRNGYNKEQITEIHAKLGQCYELSGQYGLAEKSYEVMKTYAVEQNDRPMELRSLIALSTIYSTLTPVHNPSVGEKLQKQALELADELGDIRSQATLHWNLMLNYLFSDRLTEALEHCEPTIKLARQVGDLDLLAFTLNDSGRVYQGIGEFVKAFEVFEEANKLWTKQGNQVMLADNLGASAMANCFAGNYDKALKLSEKAWEISRETDNYWGQSYSRVTPAYIYIDRGRPDLVIQYAAECIETGEKGGLIASIILVPVELAWVYGLYGAVDRGIEMAKQALNIAREKMPDWTSPALATLIRLHLLMGDIESAEKIAGSEDLNPILAVVRLRYLAMIRLVHIELELAKNNFQSALTLSDNLLEEISPLGWIYNPEIMHRKADALIGMGQFDEAHQTLTEARLLAEKLDAKYHLWLILASIADVNARLGKQEESAKCRAQAREVVEFIVRNLESVDLKDSFLNQPRVRDLMR